MHVDRSSQLHLCQETSLMRQGLLTCGWMLAICAFLCGLPSPVVAQEDLTPEHETVRAAVERGLEFLSTVEIPEAAARPLHEQVGQDCLVGLALIKGHRDPDGNKNNPRVLKAVQSARTAIRSSEFGEGYARIYSTSIAIVFLCALDAKTYRGDITQLVRRLISFQEDGGGFRDTSMSQYATLALWEAHKAGIPVPAQAWQNVANYWTVGQAEDGRYAYQPGVNQTYRPTLSVGGLGSLYICYLVGSKEREKQPDQNQSDDDDGVAGALTRVGNDDDEEEEELQQVSLNLNQLRQKMTTGDAWYGRTGAIIPPNYKYYFYYGIERYQAFREMYLDSYPDAPKWYTELAWRLLDDQREDGSWRGTYDGPHPGLVGTSYAILVLIRSTKARPQAMGEGRLRGGRGLPSPGSDILVKDGRIRIRPLQGPAEELIKIISDPQNAQYYEALAGFEDLVADTDDAQLSKHLIRFRELAEGADADPAAKAVAITAIARTRSLDDVPFLIYTLRDESMEVVRAADDGLRFISRKFGGGLGQEPTPEQIEVAIKDWKDWYLSVRPDAVFDR